MIDVKKSSICLYLLFVCLVAATHEQGVSFYETASGSMVTSTTLKHTNWAIASPILSKLGWETVSIEGDKITIMNEHCSSSTHKYISLTNQQRLLVEGTQEKIQNLGLDKRTTTMAFGLNKAKYTSPHSYESIWIDRSLAMLVRNREHFAASDLRWHHNLLRFITTPSFTSFIYRGGIIDMIPTKCLNGAERLLISRIRQEYKKHMTRSRSLFNRIGETQNGIFDRRFVHHQPILAGSPFSSTFSTIVPNTMSRITTNINPKDSRTFNRYATSGGGYPSPWNQQPKFETSSSSISSNPGTNSVQTHYATYSSSSSFPSLSSYFYSSSSSNRSPETSSLNTYTHTTASI